MSEAVGKVQIIEDPQTQEQIRRIRNKYGYDVSLVKFKVGEDNKVFSLFGMDKINNLRKLQIKNKSVKVLYDEFVNEKNGQTYKNNNVQDFQEVELELPKEESEEKNKPKVEYISSNKSLSRNDRLKLFIKENGVEDISEFLSLVKEQKLGNLTRGEIDYERTKQIDNSRDKRLFRSKVFRFINDLIIEEQEELESEQNLREIEDRLNLKTKEVDQVQDVSNVDVQDLEMKDESIGKKTDVAHKLDKVDKLIEVIKLSKVDRDLTDDEKERLLSYEAFGNVSKVFSINNGEYKNQRKELESMLDQKEYAELKESILTGYYTPKKLIKSIYNSLDPSSISILSNYDNYKVLEPAAGSGRFISYLPKELRDNANIRMYDIDSNALRINKKINMGLLQNKQWINKDFTQEKEFENNYDLIISNVPFANEKVDGYKIHDYYFKKALDLINDDGLIIFITSTGTMDKENSKIRSIIEPHFVEALRLPNDLFATTSASSDLIILKKNANINLEKQIGSVIKSKYDDEIKINEYFAANENKILGEVKVGTNQYGKVLKYKKDENIYSKVEEKLKSLNLSFVAQNKNYSNFKMVTKKLEFINEQPEFILQKEEVEELNQEVKDNLSYLEFKKINKTIYFKDENDNLNITHKEEENYFLISDYIEFKDKLNEYIDYQSNLNFRDEVFELYQKDLNIMYDEFKRKHNFLSSPKVKKILEVDLKYYLVSAIEEKQVNGKKVTYTKSNILSARTIVPVKEIEEVSNIDEAIIMSMSKKGFIDLKYMSDLLNTDTNSILENTQGKIYVEPKFIDEKYVDDFKLDNVRFNVKEEYLSGNIRQKITQLDNILESINLSVVVTDDVIKYKELLEVNKQALEEVKPKDLTIDEINFSISSSWIEVDIIKSFIMDKMMYEDEKIKLEYGNKQIKITRTAELGITFSYANLDKNKNVTDVYGTDRANGYEILKSSLNQHKHKVYDTYVDDNGKVKKVLNEKETVIASEKQELLQRDFIEYVNNNFKEGIEFTYNNLFNTLVSKQYEATYIDEDLGDISLRDHQKRAVGRVLFNQNTLLAHTVGAGKTYEMIVSGKKMIELGQTKKNLYVVPNHLVEQFTQEFYKIYPNSKVLATTKKDFEKFNRKRFISKIKLGDFEHIIIAHSQFEKIPVSKEFRENKFYKDINKMELLLSEVEKDDNKLFTQKQIQGKLKGLKKQLEKLNDVDQDEQITFEELGVDGLFVDEVQEFKNLQTITSHTRVKGINTAASKKAYDLKMKIEYLNQIGGKVIFATGTPISNSITEMYTMLSYLYEKELKEEFNINNFDSWLSTFGEIETTYELKPEGDGFQEQERVNKFVNVPELSLMFSQVADVVHAEDINLPVPEVEVVNEVIEIDEVTKACVDKIVKRAEEIRGGNVKVDEDNFLKITNDGRKLACDTRLYNKDILPTSDNIKLNKVVDNVLNIYNNTKGENSTQVIFSDIGTPKSFYNQLPHEEVQSKLEENFDVYNYLKYELVKRGVDEKEIKFIHEANTNIQKQEVFNKVKEGNIRIILGSTSKLGAGTNIQDKLIALHHVDIPWRPSDMEQREGRIIRQGNENDKVKVFRYSTRDTFDAYSWNILDKKQFFIKQIMKANISEREVVDQDDKLSFSEIKALTSSDKNVKRIFELQAEIKIEELKQENYANKLNQLKVDESKIQRQIRRQDDKMDEYRQEKEVNSQHQLLTIFGKDYEVEDDRGYMNSEYLRKYQRLEEDQVMEFGQSTDYIISLQKGTTAFSDNKIQLEHKTLGNKHEITGSDTFRGTVMRLNTYFSNLSEREIITQDKQGKLKVDLITVQDELSKGLNADKLKELEEELSKLLKNKIVEKSKIEEKESEK